MGGKRNRELTGGASQPLAADELASEPLAGTGRYAGAVVLPDALSALWMQSEHGFFSALQVSPC